ncbi:MAG TPA: oxygenase MpaB family protein [Pseudonocardiaceae bacterium]|nr:oxygenase MpaB family protein [Pseudonocardiaceae bacterium]
MAASRPVRLDRTTIVGAGLLAGGANVIMQLARPGVGYGVIESRVQSGQLHRHPIKRTRTTYTYLAVAILGTPAEKAAYRKAVNTAHAQVRSQPASPVRYNAFDPNLQLWVAACLYYGFEDTCQAFLGPLRPTDQESFYRSAATLGTTLQVRPEAWPADRAAFEKYWTGALAEIRIDEPVRRYLLDLAGLKFLPRPISILFGRFNRFVTTGFLHPGFRERMGLSWSERDQRRFDRLIAALAAVVRAQPGYLRRFPYDLLMWDIRRRLRTGRPLV